MQVEIIRLAGRSPLLFVDIPGQSDDLVRLYGHFDKQADLTGWGDDIDPWTPVVKAGKRLTACVAQVLEDHFKR